MSEINVVKLDANHIDWLAIFHFRRKNTVLLVEDNANDIELIRVAAEDEGFAVVVAETAEQAVGILHENGKKFILALVDVSLPRMSGWHFYEVVRVRWPKLRIWMMSGSENAFEGLPKGIPVTLLWKSSNYHPVFRELKKQL